MLFMVCVCCLSIAVLLLVGDGYVLMPAVAAPTTGEFDMMIAIALVLIAAFLLFVLYKARRR